VQMFAKRLAIQLAAQMPEDHDTVQAVIAELQNLYGSFLRSDSYERDHLVALDELEKPIVLPLRLVKTN
jgi:hypothetical protein